MQYRQENPNKDELDITKYESHQFSRMAVEIATNILME